MSNIIFFLSFIFLYLLMFLVSFWSAVPYVYTLCMYVCIHPMYVCIHTYIGLLRYNPDVEEPVMLIQACELSAFGFFQRGNE